MKLLIVQLGRIGDMILATPLFRAIKEKYPDSVIHVLAGRHNYLIIKDNPRISKILVYEKSPFKLVKTVLDIRKTKYDYLFDPKDHHSTESRFIARIAIAERKIGYNSKNKHIYDFPIPSGKENKGKHYIEKCLYALKPLFINSVNNIPLPELFTNPDSENYVQTFLSGNNIVEFFLINLSASKESKLYVLEKWAIIINHLFSKGSRIVLTFAPSEKHYADELSQNFNDLVLFNSRSINDVISLVKRAKILITPDTALVHIASSFNISMVALFGGLEEEFQKFRPLNENYIALRSPTGIDGIKTIEASEVIKAIDSLLSLIV